MLGAAHLTLFMLGEYCAAEHPSGLKHALVKQNLLFQDSIPSPFTTLPLESLSFALGLLSVFLLEAITEPRRCSRWTSDTPEWEPLFSLNDLASQAPWDSLVFTSHFPIDVYAIVSSFVWVLGIRTEVFMLAGQGIFQLVTEKNWRGSDWLLEDGVEWLPSV